MSRRRRGLSELADSVLAQVDHEQVVKTAALAHISPVSVKTDLGALLVKTAERVRAEAGNNEVSYADLEAFRKKYDV